VVDEQLEPAAVEVVVDQEHLPVAGAVTLVPTGTTKSVPLWLA
jgi:hypothetical protein